MTNVSLVAAAAFSRSRSCTRRSRQFSIYMFWILLLLPIDWFAPTGVLFREFGAKPATLLLTLGGGLGLLLFRPASAAYAKRENRAFFVMAFLMALNLLAFITNGFFGWSDVPNNRNPLVQFLTQSLLMLAAVIAILGNARICSGKDLNSAMQWALPRAAVVHLSVWAFEALIPDLAQTILSPFRAGGISLERASGLNTEPSYYGTMTALFGIPLLLAPQFRGKWFPKLLASALLMSAVMVNSKTMIVVAGLQAVYLTFSMRRGRVLALSACALIGAGGIYFAQSRAALDLQENMSSAMRLGSAQLAANVAESGLAVTGIGAGQFHFQYREQYAPDYLLLADEALEQMSPQAEGRASTYNFPLRVLVEWGVLGLAILAVSLTRLMSSAPANSTLAKLMLVASMAFLLTQDTYFYPPLVLACALLIAAAPSSPRKFATLQRAEIVLKS